jgi:prepilin-type N-terminal cleavage/methylation domain-containing protein
MHRKPSAFTLIELLIVVAIIAILAAIAVPNFLEAQTRAKTARCKADLRSLATAVESYRTDNNTYPLNKLVEQNLSTGPGDHESDPYPFVPAPAGGNNEFYVSDKFPLTTPIAYITSMPPDPFFRIVPGAASGTTGNSPNPKRREYQFSSSQYSAAAGSAALRGFELCYGSWRMWSGGPDAYRRDILLRQGNANTSMRCYDPTNGTVSLGDIWRTPKNPDGLRPTYKVAPDDWTP